MRKQVLPVGPSTRPICHVQRSAHRHVTCMPDENCAVSACSCRHQVSRGRHASSGHPGRHAPRYDPQTSGGAAEAASRRPGGRGGSAFFVEGEGDTLKAIYCTLHNNSVNPSFNNSLLPAVVLVTVRTRVRVNPTFNKNACSHCITFHHHTTHIAPPGPGR